MFDIFYKFFMHLIKQAFTYVFIYGGIGIPSFCRTLFKNAPTIRLDIKVCRIHQFHPGMQLVLKYPEPIIRIEQIIDMVFVCD